MAKNPKLTWSNFSEYWFFIDSIRFPDQFNQSTKYYLEV